MKLIRDIVCCPTDVTSVTVAPKQVDAFKALAHRDRLRVSFHLVQAAQPLPAHAIQTAIGLPAPTLWHHLSDLEQAGLMARERQEHCTLSTVRRDMAVELVRIPTACC